METKETKAPSVSETPKVDEGNELLTAALTYRPNRRGGDSDSIYSQFKGNVIALFDAASKKNIEVLTVRSIVGALKDKAYFATIEKEDRYRRAYNYLNNIRRNKVLPKGWVFVKKEDAVNGVAHFRNTLAKAA
jgi:hypothetical protein